MIARSECEVRPQNKWKFTRTFERMKIYSFVDIKKCLVSKMLLMLCL